jgi:mRNA interferase RelE/StbE
MQIEIYSSFARDAKKLPDNVREDISNAIAIIQASKSFSDIPRVKDMKGGKKAKNSYRMRIGDFRICFYFRNDIIELTRVLPRKDVYKVFP